MKKISIILCLAMLALSSHSYAVHGRNSHKAAGKTTEANLREENYDIKYLRFDLHLTDTSVYISGNVSTTAQVVATTMAAYVFELDSVMTIDSAKVDGIMLTATRSGFVRTIDLPAALAAGTTFTAQIFYHGTAPAGSGFFNGVTHAVSPHGTHMIYTVSDPWVAKDWWPVKQSATDKIDSMDMFITVPHDVVDGSNGVLVGVDSVSAPGYTTYHWQTHYAIDYYLVSIAVARYAQYKTYLHFTGSTDSMLIQDFLLDTATFNPLYKANFDSVGQIIDFYSSLFGRYPFWQEKYGVCYTTLPGGMENQTMTTIGVPNTYIIAHELMHQWFGDHVTYQDWGDVWLSEGFATFSEQLFLDHFWGAAAGRAHRQTLLASALTSACGELFVTDTSSATTLFYQPTVYNKGQGVVNMLRYMAPTDSMFFQALRNYQHDYAFGNATTANFKAEVEAVYGFGLDSFFQQWVYGKGYPEYTITWDQVGSNVAVKLVQATSCPSSTRLFYTPVELQFHSATGDTIVQAYNTADTQVFVYNWPAIMDSLILNPDFITVCKLKAVVKQDTTLRNTVGIAGLLPGGNISVSPNPTSNSWQVTGLPENEVIYLIDAQGRTLWHGKTGNGTAVIPGEHLAAGNYLLKTGGPHAVSVKLIHW